MATASPARKPSLANVAANRRSFATPGNPPRSPTPSSRDGISSIPTFTGNTAISTPTINRRHTIREGPGHVPHGSISSLRNGVSARSAVKRPSISGSVDMNDSAGELLEKEGIILQLRQKVAKLEAAAEQAETSFEDQMKALQGRMEEAVDEASRMEETLHGKDEVIEELEGEVKELKREKRDMENIFDAERLAWSQEKEDMADKEEELNSTIQRLKESLAQAQKEKVVEEVVPTRRSSGESQRDEPGIQFAPSSTSSSPPSRSSTNNILLQKDKIIQQLRLELAEYQIRVAEADHMGGSKVQELEQRLLEVRMANARLMEDNESFQLLLSTATLNGDFSRGDFMTNAFSDNHEREHDGDKDSVSPKRRKEQSRSRRNSVGPMGSLADELEDVEEEEDAQEAENQRRLESETKSLRDQNKALTLYINNIIERLLQHKDFEAILDKTPSLGGLQKENSAPPPPPPKQKPLIAKLFTKSTPAPKPAPQPQPASPEVNSNKPMPAIPSGDQEPHTPILQRSQSMRAQPTGLRHKRSQSDVVRTSKAYHTASDNYLVNTNVKRSSTFFGSSSPGQAGGDGYTARPARSRTSVASSASIASSLSDSTDLSSPVSLSGSATAGSVAGTKTLRPLRLLQENVATEEEELAKRNKRSSWMGWFNRGKEEEPPAQTTPGTSVMFERKDVE